MSLAQSRCHLIDVQLGRIDTTSRGNLTYTSNIHTHPFV
jgi:hypothetical protein